MGTWGIGIMQDDVAVDLEIDFKDALSEGLSVAAATDRLVDDLSAELDDEDDGPVVYLALAALQLWHGALQKDIRDKALGVITSGAGLARWEYAAEDGLTGAADLAARRDLLDRFRAILERRTGTHDELLPIVDPEPHGGPWSARSYL